LVAHPAGGRKVAGSNPVAPISGSAEGADAPAEGHVRRTGARVRSRHLPGWWPTQGDTVLYNPGGVAVTRDRGKKIPTQWEVGEVAVRDPAVSLERLNTLIAG
jgi:hypothetical protein